MNTFKWLVRRELWEARTVWVAPAICVAIIVLCALIAAFGTGTVSFDGLGPEDLAKLQTKMTPEHLDGIASMALAAIGAPFMILVMFTQFFYAIDSLYGERRERGILFWKSLPVSDAQTVLAKLFIAAILMPLAAAAAAFVTQVLVFIIASIKLGPLEILHGHLWTPSLWGGSIVLSGYLLVAGALWYLPVLGWCLLVSAWAPRSPVMYATLPPMGIALAEFIVFRTHYFWNVCIERLKLFGLLAHALGGRAINHVVIDDDHMEIPRSLFETIQAGQFFGSPAVWLGVVVGAGFVAGAIWMRRNRDETA